MPKLEYSKKVLWKGACDPNEEKQNILKQPQLTSKNFFAGKVCRDLKESNKNEIYN